MYFNFILSRLGCSLSLETLVSRVQFSFAHPPAVELRSVAPFEVVRVARGGDNSDTVSIAITFNELLQLPQRMLDIPLRKPPRGTPKAQGGSVEVVVDKPLFEAASAR
jgi:hypothetical protein